MARISQLLLAVGWLAVSDSRAETIYWFSVALANNQTSAGSPMSTGFNFELGVFNGSFVPTPTNAAQWAANWTPAQRVSYNATNKRYVGRFTVTNNAAPFTVGKPAYVWGTQAGAASSEWILLHAPAWTWPAPNPMNSFGLNWNAADAIAVIGSVDADGSPFLMKSSPVINWLQWRDAELAGEPLNAPNDDPDRDGMPNLLEFVFATPPKQAGVPSASSEFVTINSQKFLQLTLPRRVGRLAILTPQVSPDLANWSEGPAAIQGVSGTPAALVVRDLTPLGPGGPKRFMRLKAEIAP